MQALFHVDAARPRMVERSNPNCFRPERNQRPSELK
jgi:hypothetical protein